jgi:lysophospholipase L1-like esterase
VNEWIRTSGAFDGVIDFDETMRDPERPEYLLDAYDCGDNLHPNDAGYKAMADSIDLGLLLARSARE